MLRQKHKPVPVQTESENIAEEKPNRPIPWKLIVILLISAIIFTCVVMFAGYLVFGTIQVKNACDFLALNMHDAPNYKHEHFSKSLKGIVFQDPQFAKDFVIEEKDIKYPIVTAIVFASTDADAARIGVSFKEKNDILTIEFTGSRFPNFGCPLSIVTVYLPKGYKLNSLDVYVQEAITIQNVGISEIKLGFATMNSGNIKINNIKSESISVHVTHAEITVADSDISGKMYIDGTGGHIDLKWVSVGEFDARWRRGTIRLDKSKSAKLNIYSRNAQIITTLLDTKENMIECEDCNIDYGVRSFDRIKMRQRARDAKIMLTLPKTPVDSNFDIQTPGGYITIMLPSKFIKYTSQESNRAAGMINEKSDNMIDIVTTDQCEIIVKE